MTNLMRWLMYLAMFLAPYLAIVGGTIQSPALTKWMLEIKILPIILVGLFGVYSIVVVLYRAITINDCPAAERELREQIKEATEDLLRRGLKVHD